MKHLSLGSHIKMLRIERGMTQDDMVKNLEQVTGLKLGSAGLSHYETDKRIPDVSIIGALAEYFDVSIDFLMGRTDNRKAEVEPDPGLHPDNVKFRDYSMIFDDLRSKLIEEGVLGTEDSLSPDMLKLFLLLGEDTAIKVLKSKGIDPSVLLK